MLRLPNPFARKAAVSARPTSEERPHDPEFDQASDKGANRNAPLNSDELRDGIHGLAVLTILAVLIWWSFSTLSHGIHALHQQVALHAAQLAPHFGPHDTFQAILVFEFVGSIVFANKVLAAIKLNVRTAGYVALLPLAATPMTCLASGLVADVIRLWMR